MISLCWCVLSVLVWDDQCFGIARSVIIFVLFFGLAIKFMQMASIEAETKALNANNNGDIQKP